ncbi:MAG TPA: multidrug efflux SMR transporter [Solirubrobacteraceae bacterium]|jgi:small multidrug resistance pump|nr:multidrug efflux SMR transporter [Solirubrobacteraceae bacterium]
MPAGILLSLAILSEVVATVFLRYTDGFTKLAPSVVVVVGYALSFWLLALILKHLEIGFVYAVWSGAGTALIAAVGMVAFGESATALKFVSIALIIVGVVGLNASGSPA